MKEDFSGMFDDSIVFSSNAVSTIEYPEQYRKNKPGRCKLLKLLATLATALVRGRTIWGNTLTFEDAAANPLVHTALFCS